MSQPSEKVFETHMEEVLLQKSSWHPGTNAEWDVERALFPARIFAFLQETQGELQEQMRALHANRLEGLLLVKGRSGNRRKVYIISLRTSSGTTAMAWIVSLPAALCTTTSTADSFGARL